MKITMTEEEMIQKINEAVDSAMLPLLVELVALGVTQETIATAMMNVVDRKQEEHDNSAKG